MKKFEMLKDRFCRTKMLRLTIGIWVFTEISLRCRITILMRKNWKSTSRLKMSNQRLWPFIKSYWVWHLLRSKTLMFGIQRSLAMKSKIKFHKNNWDISTWIFIQEMINIIMLLLSRCWKLQQSMDSSIQLQLRWLLISIHQLQILLLWCHIEKLSHFSMNSDILCTICAPKQNIADSLEHLLKETSSKCHLKCLKIGFGTRIFLKESQSTTKLVINYLMT